jgi:hypothetical protein
MGRPHVHNHAWWVSCYHLHLLRQVFRAMHAGKECSSVLVVSAVKKLRGRAASKAKALAAAAAKAAAAARRENIARRSQLGLEGEEGSQYDAATGSAPPEKHQTEHNGCQGSINGDDDAQQAAMLEEEDVDEGDDEDNDAG